MQKSILRKLRFYMISFGVLMGFVFPIYANFFVHFREGMLIYFVIGCIGAGITVGVVSYSFVRVILLKPLSKVSRVANSLKHKNITDRIALISKDSVGDIVNGINSACENIKLFLIEIQETTEISQQLFSNLTNSGTQQSGAINSINDSIRIVTEASKSISDHSKQICFTLASSVDSVAEWELRLQGMNDYTQKLSENMSSLVQNSESINDILNTIEDIARRTNLVSVNATIEAATAGEYGKSFAVVANEIRDLAMNVTDAARDIAGYTTTISSDIQESGIAVKEITSLIEKNRSSSSELKSNLDKIDFISHSNYKADKQLDSSVEKLNSSFKAIEEVLGKVVGNTKKLQTIILNYNY